MDNQIVDEVTPRRPSRASLSLPQPSRRPHGPSLLLRRYYALLRSVAIKANKELSHRRDRSRLPHGRQRTESCFGACSMIAVCGAVDLTILVTTDAFWTSDRHVFGYTESAILGISSIPMKPKSATETARRAAVNRQKACDGGAESDLLSGTIMATACHREACEITLGMA